MPWPVEWGARMIRRVYELPDDLAERLVVAIDPMEKDVLENLRHLADSIGGALKNP